MSGVGALRRARPQKALVAVCRVAVGQLAEMLDLRMSGPDRARNTTRSAVTSDAALVARLRDVRGRLAAAAR